MGGANSLVMYYSCFSVIVHETVLTLHWEGGKEGKKKGGREEGREPGLREEGGTLFSRVCIGASAPSKN